MNIYLRDIVRQNEIRSVKAFVTVLGIATAQQMLATISTILLQCLFLIS